MQSPLLGMLILFILTACNPSETGNQFNQVVSLKIGEKENIDGDKLIIGFEEVLEDSRCPSGTECFWEGRARIVLEIIEDGQAQNLELIKQAGREELSTDTLNGKIYELVELSPYPDVNDELPIPKERYVADIVVRLEE